MNGQARKLLEETILVTALLRGEKFDKLSKFMDEKDFSIDFHKRLVRAMHALHIKGIVSDLITVRNQDQTLTATQITRMISEITDTMSMTLLSADNVPGRVKQLREMNLIQAASDGQDISTIRTKLEELSRQGLDKLLTPEEVVQRAQEIIKERSSSDRQEIYYPFDFLQEKTRGIHKGQLVVVAGRPSVGKSALLQNMAVCCLDQGLSVLFASAEMSNDSLILRFLSQLDKQNYFYLDKFPSPDRAKELLEGKKLYFHQFSGTEELEEKIIELAGKIDIVFVDYLQVISPKAGRINSQQERLGFVVTDLVDMKNRFDLPIVAGSQYNRDADETQPSMADLYQSGKIEQAADVVISLWRRVSDESTEEGKKVKIDLLKNRNGMTFANSENKEYALWFNGKTFEFTQEVSTNEARELFTS